MALHLKQTGAAEVVTAYLRLSVYTDRGPKETQQATSKYRTLVGRFIVHRIRNLMHESVFSKFLNSFAETLMRPLPRNKREEKFNGTS